MNEGKLYVAKFNADGTGAWVELSMANATVAGFTGYAWKLWRNYSDTLARKTFRFSIWHLMLLFAALLIDHYLGPML